MHKILIIEDCSVTGPLLLKFTNQELPRLVTRPEIGATPHSPVTGDPFIAAAHEPAQGQLYQLRHVFKHVEQDLRDHRKYTNALSVYPEAMLFPPIRLGELKALASRYDPDTHAADSSAACDLRAAVNNAHAADVIVVDLALDEEEGRGVEESGGLQVLRRSSERVNDEPKLDAVEGHAAVRQSLPDPRPTLRQLTGFRILAAFANCVPVIATSYLSNPLVRQHCIVSGAVGFVSKPVESKDRLGDGLDFLSVKSAATQRELSAKNNDDVLDVVVTNYLTEAVAEIVKALGLRWLWTTAPSFPQGPRPLNG